MIAALLLLASIALIVLKAAGILAISWVIALLPAAVLLALGVIGTIVFLVIAAFATRDL